MNAINKKATAATKARYNRIARVYNLMELFPERSFRYWRETLWARVRGPKVLELGVGTGKNMLYYLPGMEITAVDLSPDMLQKARKEAAHKHIRADLQEADAQALPFPDASFDTVVATFVFCSVPDPVLGLTEAKRVLKPGGQLLLIEHVLSRHPFMRNMMNLLNPLVVRIMGANINRETVENVHRAMFRHIAAEPLAGDIVCMIEAHTPEDDLP